MEFSNKVKWFLFALVVGVFSGCGGGGGGGDDSGSSGSFEVESIYVGTYSGTFSYGGTWTGTIASSGTIIIMNGDGTTALTGQLDSQGSFSGDYSGDYAGGTEMTGQLIGFSISGTWRFYNTESRLFENGTFSGSKDSESRSVHEGVYSGTFSEGTSFSATVNSTGIMTMLNGDTGLTLFSDKVGSDGTFSGQIGDGSTLTGQIIGDSISGSDSKNHTFCGTRNSGSLSSSHCDSEYTGSYSGTFISSVYGTSATSSFHEQTWSAIVDKYGKIILTFDSQNLDLVDEQLGSDGTFSESGYDDSSFQSFEGQIIGDSISGTWEWESQMDAGTFSGTKQ